MTHKQENEDSHNLSKKDITLLRSRIFHSINKYQRKKRIFKYGISAFAAVMIVLVSISIFSDKGNKNSSIESYAKSQNKLTDSESVQLILNDNKSIEANSNISYSNNGEKIKIGDLQNVSQTAKSPNSSIYNTLVVPFGKRSEIILSDGTKVWLNSGSKLIFPAKFASEKREVYLEGEAIFEVSHNKEKPFFVKSKNNEVKVLGTVFNISNYNDDDFAYTVLKSGSVQIIYTSDKLFKNTEIVKITPGEMLTFNKKNRTIKEETVDVDHYFSWRHGIFIFKNNSLKSIMKKISRYYNVEITITDTKMANETFSGYLDVKDSIESVLETIKETETSGFEYTITDDKISIN